MVEIKTKGLLEKTQERLKAAKAYAKADGREAQAERLYEKLKGKYYRDDDIGKIKIEGVAGYTYQTRPTIHLRRPHVSVSAKTPKFVTSVDNKDKQLNNARNAIIAELALNQEYQEIEIEDEVNAVVQDVVCPYPVGSIKIGYSYETQFSELDEYQKVVSDRIWGMRVRPFEVFIDSQAVGRKSYRYYFHEIWKPTQWVKDNKDFSSAARKQIASNAYPKWLENRRGVEDKSAFDMTAIYELHDLEHNQIAVFSEGASDWLLDPYDFPYPFRGGQFLFFNPWPLNDDFYGRCGASLIESQIDETNLFRSRSAKVLKRFPVVNLYNKGAWSIEQQRKWKDADDCENLEVNDINQIRTEKMPGFPGDWWRYQEVVERDQEKISGSSSMRRGEVTAVKPTTAQIIEGHGNLRDADIREEVGKLYSRMAHKHLALMAKYYTRPKWIKITGGLVLPKSIQTETTDQGPFLLYTNEDIKGNYDFSIDVQSLVPVNKEVQAKVLMETIQGVARMADIQIPTIQDAVHSFFKNHDIEKMFVEVVKMQGVDLNKWKKEDEPEELVDPALENEHVLKGGLLADPDKDEPHEFHERVHGALAQSLGSSMDPRFTEIARHLKIHTAHRMTQAAQQPQRPIIPQGQQPMTQTEQSTFLQQGVPPVNMPGAVPMAPQMPQNPPVIPQRAGILNRLRGLMR